MMNGGVGEVARLRVAPSAAPGLWQVYFARSSFGFRH